MSPSDPSRARSRLGLSVVEIEGDARAVIKKLQSKGMIDLS